MRTRVSEYLQLSRGCVCACQLICSVCSLLVSSYEAAPTDTDSAFSDYLSALRMCLLPHNCLSVLVLVLVAVCQHIAEQHEQQQQQHKQRLSSPGVSNRLHSGGQRAAAVAEGVLQLSLDPMQQQQQQGGSQSGQQPHHQQQQQQQQQARFVL